MTNVATRFQPDISGSAVPSGFIGEKLSATTSDVQLTTSGTSYNAASLILTAGTWIVFAKAGINIAGTTQPHTILGISTTSATLDQKYYITYFTSTVVNNFDMQAMPYYISTTGQTIYLVANATFTGANPASVGARTNFYAVRIA